jgi:hypothetical protein
VSPPYMPSHAVRPGIGRAREAWERARCKVKIRDTRGFRSARKSDAVSNLIQTRRRDRLALTNTGRFQVISPRLYGCPRALADLSLVGHCPALRRAPRTRGSTILVVSVGGPALVMLRACRHLLEGVGGVVHDNERPRLCLAVVIVDKIES